MATATVQAGALDALVREAAQKLASAGNKGNLHTLPMLYLLGDTNAARTTAVLRTGWNAELLAGEVSRDGEVPPTATLNLWYADGVLLAEAGAALRDDPAQMRRLFTSTRPGSAGTAFRGAAPLRAAVVCVSCERLLGDHAATELQAIAARTGESLRELSKFLGYPVPVYVLFTKADRIPYFAAWARNLSTDETQLLLGAAPQNMTVAGSTWGETASAAVLRSYDEMIAQLAATRLELLSRESDSLQAAECYEFPREMRKLRASIAAFLVELVRPSQLHASPLLRSFCFTGIRAHIVEQVVSEPAPLPQTRGDYDVGATQVFRSIPAAPAAAQPRLSRTVSQKTAQWVFLPRFFSHAVLRDAQSLAGRGAVTRSASLLRRAVYGTVAALLLVYLAALIVSFVHNRALEQQALTSQQNLTSLEAGGAAGTLATTAELTELNHLRGLVAQLESWQRNGAPLGYRWGLYRGNDLLTPARHAYFAHFRTLLLQPVQNHLVQELSSLPSAPPPNADYNSTYSALRAYLMTTSNPEKSTAAFLAPVLTAHWPSGAATPSAEQSQLAQLQFAFYGDELPRENPLPSSPVEGAVNHARTYLAAFGGFERIYQSILTAADKQAPSIDFNAQYPRSAEVIVEPHSVQGAFTPAGYTFVQNALAHPDVYFRGETWVLGDQAPPTIDPASLVQQLTARYTADYLATWRAFVHDAQIVRARNLPEASNKLALLSGTNSPLLALIYTVSHNTAIADKTIADAFQAPQALVAPANKDQYLGPPNKAYIDGLLGLRSSIQLALENPAGVSDPAAAAPVAAAASAAHLAAQQTAQGFHLDPQGHIDTATLALMEAPITSVDALVRGLGPAAANAGGKSFCAAANALFAKMPFNPSSSVQAAPAEVAALLQPGTGQFWQFYNTNLKSLLVQQGSQYGVAPNPPMQVNPAFVSFFNRMANLSAALFPAGATEPTLTFMLRNQPTRGAQSATLKVDAQSLSLNEPPKQFTWHASPGASASLTANGLPLSFTGPWALFELFSKSRSQAGNVPGSYELNFPLELANTPVRAADGTPIVVDYELSGAGAPLLAPGGLSSLRCVSTVAR